jgi:hypothetical protein
MGIRTLITLHQLARRRKRRSRNGASFVSPLHMLKLYPMLDWRTRS